MMTTSNFDYDNFLKQLSENNYLLEEVEDNSTTFECLLKSAIDSSINKKQTLQNLNISKMLGGSELTSEKQLLRSLEEKRLKIDETIQKEVIAIKSQEKERDDLISKYSHSVDKLHDELSSVSDAFNPDMLKQHMNELKCDKNEIEGDIARLLKQKQIYHENMGKLNIEWPDVQDLKQIRSQIFDENDELGKRKRELDNINTFINDLKSKVPQVNK